LNLVTGGAGFIGSQLVAELVSRGEAVRVLELAHAAVDHLPANGVEVVRGDIRDRASVRRAVRGCRRVYHLAANPNLWTRDRRDFDAVNHRGAVNVLEEALDAGAERVLHASTESILTSRRFTGGAVDSLELRREDMIGPYCLSKFLAEEAALSLAHRGAPVIVVNPTLPIGPGDRGQSPPTRMTVAFCKGKLPAYLDCRFNMIDARDVALGMIAAMDSGQPGRRYLLGAWNLTLAQWLAEVGRAVSIRPPRWKVPYWFALAAASVSEFLADRVTGRIPIATVTGVRLARNVMHFDAGKSHKELGFVPRPLTESIHDAIAWYRFMGWI
jgi:dihydroflavonol-4-reductase